MPQERETVRNEERGCGFLKNSKAYVRSPPRSADGELPAFVEFDPYIPYLERTKFRGYEYFPGISFELSVTGGVGVHAGTDYERGGGSPDFRSPDEVREDDALDADLSEIEGLAETDPAGEVWRHVQRLVASADGDHAGDVTAFHSHDLYMHVGASYYDTPEEFIEEVEEQGLSKAIPVSESQEPPVINPGFTRLFLVHPKATGEENDKPGVIGYVYLHRTIYTEDEEGRFPNWAKKQAKSRDDMDLVHIGDKVYEDGTRETCLGQTDSFGGDEDDESPRGETESSPESVVPSDKPGRDVEGVESSTLDEEEIRDQLDDAADEIREFEESTEKVDSETWVEAEFVEVPRPDECPECHTILSREEMEGGGTVRYCSSCGWDNSTDVNAALVEHELRQEDYNDLRRRASEQDLNPGRNPSADDLVRVLLKDMGLI